MSETQQKCQKLFSACMSGDRFALVQVIKSEGIKPSAYDMVDDQGKTALHVACRYGHIDVVRTLIEVYGCSRQAVDNTGSTPFHDACYYDQVVILDYLIHSSVAPKEDLLAIDVHGNTCFHKANEAGSSRVINYIFYIVFSGSTPEKYYFDINSETLLHPNFQTLPDFNIFIANKAGDTPIAVACRHGHLNIIKLYVHCCEIFFGVLDELKDLFSIASSSGQFEIAYYLQCKLKCQLSPPVSLPHVNVHSKLSFIRGIQILQNPSCHCSNLYCQHRSEEALQSLQNFQIIKSESNWTIGDFGFNECSSSDCKFHLCMAVLHKNEEFTSKFLTLQGNGVYHCGDTNLCVAACVADDVSTLKSFLSKKVEKNTTLCKILLILACEWGSKDTAEFLVTTERCSLDIKNNFGETPLHIACKFNREEIVKMLCESEFTGITINALSHLKETPLHLASVHASPAVAKHVLKSEHLSEGGFDIPNIYGDTPLMIACRSGNVELVQLLVENGSNPLFVNDQLKEMPIHIACRNQRLDMLKILVSNLHAKVDDRNYLEETPLCVALKFSYMDIVNFLVNRKLCDVSLQLRLPDSNSRQMQQFIKQIMIPEVHDSGEHSKSTGDCALHFACKMNDVQLIQLLLSHCPQAVSIKDNFGNTPLHIAAENGNVAVMKCLLESFEGCLDSLINKDKDSPLHLACKVGFLEVVNLLLDRCYSSVTLKNRFGDNPIHVACQHKSCELIDSLLKKCSGNLDCHKNDRNNTFLHVAANYGNSDTVRLLLNHCSATCQNEDGNTPLHVACFLNKRSVVECLLDRMNSDHAFVNKKMQTYLHAACNDKAQLTIVKLLYEKGFRSLANMSDENGNMPLHYAFRSNQKGIVEYLMTDGCCDPYKTNNDGLTPVYLAIQQQNIQLIEHILSKNLLDPNQPVKKGSPLLHSLIELPTKQYPGISYPYNPSVEVSDPAMHYSPLSVQLLMKMLTDKTTNIDLNAPDSHGNTALHLACGYEQYESVRILVSTESVGQSISHRNSEGKRPIQLTSDYRIIRLLISYGANPEDVYHRFAPILKRSKEEQPLESAVKVIVIGNSTAGKTTLIETLRSDGKDVMEVKGATAGIEQTNYDSREFGKVVFHDFAGQPEYDSCHSAFLERCSSSLQPPLFLVVINSSESRNNIKKQIHQWLSFVHNHCNFNSETPPHVIVIGSHLDILKDVQISYVQDFFAKAIENFKSSDFKCCEPVFLDCRKGSSEGMKALQLRLKESCTSLTKFIELDCQCHILFANIVRWFPSKPVKIKDLQHRIKQRTPTESLHTLKPRVLGPAIFPGGLALPLATVQDAHSPELLLPTSLDPLVTLLKSLHSGGHILLLDAETPEDAWIVMNQDSLFKEVNGILFAPQDFEQHLELDNNTGVVPITKLQSLFPELDFNMVRQFLLHYEFCQQIEDAKTLELIHGSRELQPEQGPLHNIYYFFPGLIKSDKPTNVWDTPEDSPYSFSCGWMLQCQSKHFFETRFLHVLLLRLTFYFVESSSKSAVFKRRCNIWKNGIQWCTRDGVEVLVELVEEKSVLLVLVRCYQGQELEAIKLRTAVFKKVCQTKEEFCPKVHVDEYLIHPSALSKSTPHSSSNDRISISEVAQTVIEGKLFVVCPNNRSLPLKALLYYEPYSCIGKKYLESFFKKEKMIESIPSDILLELAKSLHPLYEHIIKILKIPEIDVDFLKEIWRENPTILLHRLFKSWASRTEHPTFQTLRSEFDEYSIFFGRDPLVSKLSGTDNFQL